VVSRRTSAGVGDIATGQFITGDWARAVDGTSIMTHGIAMGHYYGIPVLSL
jgi:hypothetical protein